MSLARRYLLANLLILLVAGLAVGIWIGDQLERSIIERTASVTALYVESIIEPSVASMADGGELTAEEVGTLDQHLASSTLSDRVRSLRLWSADGRVVYSPNADLIGQRFPVEGHLAEAWAGEVTAGMDDLGGAENAWERARWERLLEVYIPVRERGSDRIIAVAEFYLPPREIDEQVAAARLAVRAVHVADDVAGYVVALARATRESPLVRLGASPRASLALQRAAQASAALDGRDFVVPDDVQALAEPVLAHRLLLARDTALAGQTAGSVLRDLLREVPVPAEPGESGPAA